MRVLNTDRGNQEMPNFHTVPGYHRHGTLNKRKVQNIHDILTMHKIHGLQKNM